MHIISSILTPCTAKIPNFATYFYHMPVSTQVVEDVVIKFAGDSGDGM